MHAKTGLVTFHSPVGASEWNAFSVDHFKRMLGAFTNCEPGNGFGTLTLDEVFDDYFKPLGIPAWRGAQFGHIKKKWTLPIGLPVEMDAGAGTIRLLQSAVL